MKFLNKFTILFLLQNRHKFILPWIIVNFINLTLTIINVVYLVASRQEKVEELKKPGPVIALSLILCKCYAKWSWLSHFHFKLTTLQAKLKIFQIKLIDSKSNSRLSNFPNIFPKQINNSPNGINSFPNQFKQFSNKIKIF